MKRVSIFLVLLLLSVSVFAQNGIIEFSKMTHDFGNVNEEKGPVNYEFKFTNKGTTPIIISNVKASCGCTTPAWSKDPVMPGKTGFIKAEYDTKNRGGVFNKSLTVTANTEPAITTLFIKGNVIPKPKTPKEEFPDTLGNLRLMSRTLNLSTVSTKEPVTKEFTVYNDGNAALTISNVITGPKHIKVVTPASIAPKSKGILKVTYDARAKNDFGYVIDNITLLTNDSKMPKKNLVVGANINEYFAPLSAEDLAKAPKLSVANTFHDFGNMKAGEVVNKEFDFTNTGKQDLIIRKTKATCGCIVGQPEKTTLKPGDKSKIKITFNSTGKEGVSSQTVTLYSNDPSNPTQTLTIKANVAKAE